MSIITKTTTTIINCPDELSEVIDNNSVITKTFNGMTINGNTIDFDFSYPLTATESTELDNILSSFSCNVNSINFTPDNVVGTIYSMSFLYGSKVKNRWLSYAGQTSIPSNSTNAVVPFDSKLITMSFTNRYSCTVDLKLRKALYGNGNVDSDVLIWNVVDERTGVKSDLVDVTMFNKGDKIGIYAYTKDEHKYPNDIVVTLYLQIMDIDSINISESYKKNF